MQGGLTAIESEQILKALEAGQTFNARIAVLSCTFPAHHPKLAAGAARLRKPSRTQGALKKGFRVFRPHSENIMRAIPSPLLGALANGMLRIPKPMLAWKSAKLTSATDILCSAYLDNHTKARPQLGHLQTG